MNKLKGVYTAIITPFDSEGLLDEQGFRQLIQRQLQSGIDGIVALGTTGEAPTLSEEEQKRVIVIARQEIRDGVPLVIGTGCYSTAASVKKTCEAEELGADQALVVVPYYNKPTQEGIFQHFKAIASAVQIPIIIYNHPGRTGSNLQIDTLKRLAEIPNIIGIKETSGNITQISDVIEAVRGDYPDFSVMSGDDALTLPLMALGGNGVISVVSNLIPSEIKTLTEAAQQGNWELARELHYRLMPLMRSVFIETNPIAIKAALELCALPSGACRLPLCDLSPANKAILAETVQRYVNNAVNSHRSTLGYRVVPIHSYL